MMNAYFINPFSQNITTVDYDGDYKSISRMIDASRGCFDVVRLYRNQDAAFVDDEGLYVNDQAFWIHRNYPSRWLARRWCWAVMTWASLSRPRLALKHCKMTFVLLVIVLNSRC